VGCVGRRRAEAIPSSEPDRQTVRAAAQALEIPQRSAEYSRLASTGRDDAPAPFAGVSEQRVVRIPLGVPDDFPAELEGVVSPRHAGCGLSSVMPKAL